MTTTVRARKGGKGIKKAPSGKAKVKRIAPAKGKTAKDTTERARRESTQTHPRTADKIRAELDKAEAALAAYGFDDLDGLAKHEAKVEALRIELDAAQLADVGEVTAPDSLAKIFDGKAQLIACDAIVVDNETQRARMSGPEVERLARQIAAAGGLLHDVGVVELAEAGYLLIWGARRVGAHKLLDEVKISARVFPPNTTPEQISMLRTIENFGRADLTPVARALAVAEMLDSIARTLDGDSTSESMRLGAAIGEAGSREAYVGRCLGRDEQWVRDYAFVAKLGGLARELLAERRIDLGHARELAKVGDRQNADGIARRAARDVHGQGGKPVAWVREQVEADMRDLSKVAWRLDVAFGEDKEKGCAGWACSLCPHNAVTQPLLFGLPSTPTTGAADDVEGPVGICSNGACFAVKLVEAPRLVELGIKRLAKEIKARGEMPLTKSALEQWTPPEIRVEHFVREAKKALNEKGERIDTPTKAGKGGDDDGEGTSKSSKSSTSKASPKVEAEREHAAKLETWATKAAKALCKAIDAKPGRLTYYLMVRNANQLASMQRGDEAKNRKAVRVASAAPARALFKRFGKPELRDLIALEKQLNFAADSYKYDIERLVPQAVELLADALGVTLDAPPELAEVKS